MGRRRPGSTACTGSNGSGMQFGCGARPWRYISRPLRMFGTSPMIGVSACRGQRQCAMRACDGACSLGLFGWVPCQQGHRFRPRCYCVVQCEANLACTTHGAFPHDGMHVVWDGISCVWGAHDPTAIGQNSISSGRIRPVRPRLVVSALASHGTSRFHATGRSIECGQAFGRVCPACT